MKIILLKTKNPNISVEVYEFNLKIQYFELVL